MWQAKPRLYRSRAHRDLVPWLAATAVLSLVALITLRQVAELIGRPLPRGVIAQGVRPAELRADHPLRLLLEMGSP